MISLMKTEKAQTLIKNWETLSNNIFHISNQMAQKYLINKKQLSNKPWSCMKNQKKKLNKRISLKGNLDS